MMSSTAKATYIQSMDSSVKVQKFLNLLWALVVRDIKGRYRRSLLGPAWAILQPLLYMVIFTFIRGVFNITSEGVPYVIFTYSALVPWTFFSNAVTRCGSSVSTNAGILKKISVNRLVFPVSSVVSSFVDFLISSIILIGMMIWFRMSVGPYILWLPLLVLMAVLLALGVGLGVAAIGTYKHDIIFAMPFLMQFWLLATPIMYPIGKVPERWQFFYSLNPMVGIIEGFRAVLLKGIPPDLGLLAWSLLGIVVIWIVAWPIFKSVSQYFADVL